MDTVTLYRGSKLAQKTFSNSVWKTSSGILMCFWPQERGGDETALQGTPKSIPGLDNITVLTPDDVMDGASSNGSVVIFDDEHYYMGGVLAEKLQLEGHKVLGHSRTGHFQLTHHTMERGRIQSACLNRSGTRTSKTLFQ